MNRNSGAGKQASNGDEAVFAGNSADIYASRMRRVFPGDPDPAMLAKLHQPKFRAKPIGPSPSVLEDFILDTLEYKSMRDREEEVIEAHNKTLEWIFAREVKKDFDGVHFITWLETSQHGPIYWISGKPGSGKSTLMRFLFESEETINRLEIWAGDIPVATAGFFFWTSGSREQRSQTGLLRYLLHQLLSGDDTRKLIPVAFSDLWAKLIVMSTKERIAFTINWTVSDLMKAIDAFMDAALKRMSVCLFIDGLDEFEGDHREIIHFFKALGEKVPKTGHGSVKMCLSSRPWDVFEAAFQYSVPNLKLQDLTTEDMQKYAVDRLNSDVRLRRVIRKQTNQGAYEAFVKELVQRADGVFLWVRLAIDKIVQSFSPGHGLDDIQATLRSLPTELDFVFEKLLFKDQSPPQISKTASLFKLICAREIVAEFLKDESSNSLTVWEVAFALHKEDDDDALDPELTPSEADDEHIIARCESTKTFAHDRFAGLLEVHEKGEKSRNRTRGARFTADETAISIARRLAQSKLIYIHRTVRDWLMDPNNGVRERLQSEVPKDFDANLRLLRSYILRIKLPLEEPERHRRLNDWWPDIALAMTHARYVSDDSELLRGFVNELDDTLSWYWLTKPGNEGDHWARAAFGSYEVRMKAPPIREPFLCLAAKFGLTRYIREDIEARNQEDDDEETWGPSTPLLTYAIEFLCSRALTIYPLSDPKLVEYLLTHPVSLNPGPNDEYVDFLTRKPRTPWIAVLRHLRDARRRRWIEYYDVEPMGVERWARIVESFVTLGGADVDAVVMEDRWDPEITAVGVMELLEETYGSHEMRELKQLVGGGRDQ